MMRRGAALCAISGSTAAGGSNTTARPRVLSLCCVYPNPAQPRQGIFVQRRLQGLAELTDLKVVSPVAFLQYGNPRGERLRLGRGNIPGQQEDGKLTILYPRWFYPPFSGGTIPVWLFVSLAHDLLRIRRKFPFEIIDTHFGFPEGIAGYLLSSFLGVPFTMTFRGNEPKHSLSRIGRFWMTRAARKASRIFAVSERLRQFAIDLGAAPEGKTISTESIRRCFRPRDRVACRIKHGLALDRPVILSAGALVERKGHHRILEALRSIASGGTSVQLAIAGAAGPEGQYERKLRDLTTQLGLEESVRFLGGLSPEALAEVMSACDVFCLASTNEGWPNVVHEALACGAPVVATDVGAVPEMLAGGQNGLVVPVKNRAALASALQEALGRDWDRQAIAAWGRARSWGQVASEVFAEMQTILEERRRKS